MESTVAFSTLMELIQVVGAFVTAPIFFNLSVIHILIISFVFNMVIGILLGGVAPRQKVPTQNVTNNTLYADYKVLSVDNVRTISPSGVYLNRGSE